MAGAVMLGIVAAHLTDAVPLWGWLATIAVTSIISGTLLIINKKEICPTATCLLLITLVAIGALRCRMDDPRYDTLHWSQHCKTPSYLTLRLKESPIPRERSWKTTAEVESIDGHETHGTLQLFLRKDSTAATLRYGDQLLVHGYVDTVHGNLYTTSDHYLVTAHDSTSLRAHSEHLRMKLLRRMQGGPLERRYAGVAEAMTLGWRGDLEDSLRFQFRDAGIMHLLCVSGLHIGLLAALVGGAFFWLGEERRGRIIRGSMQLLAVWSFVLLTGTAPATVRAALMFSLFIVSRMMARHTDSMNLLATAALLMLFTNPLLLFNIGWQLSFSAVAGILLARPLIRRYHNLLWKSATVSLAATLATLPVTLITFHQIHPYFLIANIVIVPLAGLLLAVSLLYMMVPCDLTALLAEWPIRFCDLLTESISHLPGAVITVNIL